MASEKSNRKEKNQNIQVFVRLRPLNQRERDIKSLGVVEVVNGKEVVVKQSQQTSLTKKFTFDRAFAPNAKQVEVYHEVVSPLIEEVLAGYNCTVFAYGQTGTGKTHTMVGEHTGEYTSWQNDPLAGIIPRALSQLFDELRLSNNEYTVRVSYLELYNEELFDLLSSSEDNSKLRIYEDVTRKGSNIVNGLEEITVYNKNEVYKIMDQGQERKRVASTLMNAQSSRSHTVFTIVVHMKENSPEGEELVKIGKLNLVDLAGSENISKAGSDNPAKKERARECVNINQSLLTLGRVITALVERHPHIPYRESKLTRILQESLGGRTKTSIIATISPGHKDLEESMSTLEYAHRAKNIQNKPEINQKLTKKAILKEFAEEIDKLKRDLQAARDKNGVYLANETFAEMTIKAEEQNKEIQNLILQKRAMEEGRDKAENIFKELSSTLHDRELQLHKTKTSLEDTKHQLCKTKTELEKTVDEFEEQKHLVNKHWETEKVLSEQASTLLHTAEVATSHVNNLHESVDKRRSIESYNLEATRAYREQSRQLRDHVSLRAATHTDTLASLLAQAAQMQDEHKTNSTDSQKQNVQKIERLAQMIVESMSEIRKQTADAEEELSSQVSNHRQSLEKDLKEHCGAVEQLLSGFVNSLTESVTSAREVDVRVRDNMENYVEQWYTGGSQRVSSLCGSQSRFMQRAREGAGARTQVAAALSRRQRQHVAARDLTLRQYLQKIEDEKSTLDEKLNNKIREIETERQETEERLQKWVEEERKSFEERLLRHVTEEKNVLENKLAQKLAIIEEEKRLLDERIHMCKEWQQAQMLEVSEGLEIAESIWSQYEREAEESLQSFSNYDKEFSEGACAISSDMEAFRHSVMDLVDHNRGEVMGGICRAQGNIEESMSAVMSTDKECAERLQQTCSEVFSEVERVSDLATNNVLSTVETYNNNCQQHLTQISESITSNISSLVEHDQVVAQTLSSLETEVADYQEDLLRDVASHQQLEDKFLQNEYRTYSPSGHTPMRQQYAYPRSLAATSPHERLLERFRATRLSTHSECIVIEDNEPCSTSVSDSDNSSSEAPLSSQKPHTMHTSQDLTKPKPVANGHLLTKSTSESDIYAFRKNDGKENLEHVTSSTKKPSKLPALMSLKKPLLDRNTMSTDLTN